MQFGPLPIAEAEGAILAHALHLPGDVWRKGRVLSADDLVRLQAAGHTTVTAAKLEDDDIAEDEAAGRIAATLAGPGVRVSAAFTGRVNLYAAVDGVLCLDEDRLNTLNQLDESITVATLPAFSAVAAGRMVATVKIIPFAAPRTSVEAAHHLGGPQPIQVAPWLGLDAGLIQTVLPGTRSNVLDKTAEVTRARLERVGAHLRQEVRVAHDPDAVADALTSLQTRGCGLLLLLGASAVTDRRDVLPSAIIAAGGEVQHFGMPVDPGNLLLLGRVGSVPVLGLPGCARSPKLNGFDWVLARIAAGLNVTRTDIMRMGIGGLLTEIPTRPLPRDQATEPPRAPRICALVLAAGLSRRMGSNKLLAELEGKPLIRWAVEAALASHAAAPVVVVTGHQEEAIRTVLSDLPVLFTHAADHDRGLSASLKAGLAALPDGMDGVMVLLGDMPRVQPAHLNRLIAAYSPAENRTICLPTHGGRRGNPVLWDRQFFPEILELTGDTGARALLTTHEEAVCEVEMPDDGVLLDIDTPDALALARLPRGLD